MGKKQLQMEKCKNKNLSLQIQSIQDRTSNLKKEETETTTQYEKINIHNNEVEEVNIKLRKDFDAVQKHLISVKNTNDVLRKSLGDYCETGHKIAKLVIPD